MSGRVKSDKRASSQIPAFALTVSARMAAYHERLASRIAQERKRKGLSREEAAHRIGISFRQYQRWETGQSEPRDTNLYRLAKVLGVPVEELRPDLEAEERALQAQLDRLEALLIAVARASGVNVEAVLAEIEINAQASEVANREAA